MVTMDALGTAANAATVLAESAALLSGAAESAGPIRGRSSSTKLARQSAYLAFQRASLDAMSWAEYAPVLEDLARRVDEHVIVPELLRVMKETRQCLAHLMATLVEVRMVGNPRPRASAEDIIALIGGMYGCLPAGRPTVRQ
jgi:hypothetical protein